MEPIQIWVNSILGILGPVIGVAGLVFGLRQQKIKQDHEKELERFRSEKTLEIETLRRDKELEIETLRRDKELEIEDLRRDKELQVENLRRDKDFQIETQKREKELEIEDLRRENQIKLARVNLEVEYDKDLRLRRIDAYQNLGRIFEMFEFNNFEDIQWNKKTYSDFYVKIRDWYNNVGGIFLSIESNRAFEELNKDALKHRGELIINPYHELGELMDRYKSITSLIEKLRIELIKDIGTRKSINLQSNLMN